MSGFHSNFANNNYNSKKSFDSFKVSNKINKDTDFHIQNSKEYKGTQIVTNKTKDLIKSQGISISIIFFSSLLIGKDTSLNIIFVYGLLILSVVYSIYKGIQICPSFFHKIGYGFYPLLFVIVIIPILSDLSIISWNPLNWFKFSIHQLTNFNSNYITSLQISIYYNDIYKIIYLFHILVMIIGSNYLFLNELTTSQNFIFPEQKKVDVFNAKGFFQNIFNCNGNNNQYSLSDLKTNFAELSEKNFHYYKEKRVNDKAKNKSKELNLFFVENLSTCHEVISLNNKLIAQNGKQYDLSLFKAIGWEIYEPKDMVESDTNYDELISVFIRPKQEEDLQHKLNALEHIQETNDIEEEFAEEEDYNPLREQAEEMLIKQHYELGIIRNFHSVPNENEKTTVIVRDVNEPYYKIYSKGPLEEILQICKKETIPPEVNQKIQEYQSDKERFCLLGLCVKMIKMSYSQSQEVNRTFLETNMIFLGVVIVEKN